MKETGIIFVSANQIGWVPKLIRFFRKPFVSNLPSEEISTHVAIVFLFKNGEFYLGEATNPKIRIFPLKRYLQKTRKIELWQIEGISLEKHKEALKHLLPIVSDTYGYLQLLGFVWVWAAKKLGFDISNPVKFKREVLCGEYVYFYLKDIGFQDEELMSMNPNNIAPDTIRKAMQTGAKLIAVSQYGEENLAWL